MLAVTIGVETVPATSTYYLDAGGRLLPMGRSPNRCISKISLEFLPSPILAVTLGVETVPAATTYYMDARTLCAGRQVTYLMHVGKHYRFVAFRKIHMLEVIIGVESVDTIWTRADACCRRAGHPSCASRKSDWNFYRFLCWQ